jgi:hypothetical protein
VDGLEDEPIAVDANPYAMGDNLHPRDMHHSLDNKTRAPDAANKGQNK